MESGAQFEKKKLRSPRRGVIIGATSVVLAAAFAALWLLFIFAGGRFISRSEGELDLRSAGVERISPLLRLKNPEKIDLRGNDISHEDFAVLSEAFPGCEILWDVPLGGVGEVYDCLSESVAVPVFHPDKAELYALMPNLKDIDLRDAVMTVEDFELLRSAVPGCEISWSVPVAEGLRPDNGTQSLTLASAEQAEALMLHGDYLKNIREINLGYTDLTTEQWERLSEAFPEAAIDYCVEIAGQKVHLDALSLDLSSMESGQVEAVIETMKLLPRVKDVELMTAGGESALSVDDVAALAAGCPGVRFHYSFELFGKSLSTDMERVEYFGAEIGDEGLEQFRKVLPFMHSLQYLRLDDCGTGDEAMAQLRDDFPDIKVVWRVFMGQFSCPTDTLKVWATYSLTNETAAKLKYCTDVRYMDLGHNEKLSDVSFLQYMPDLEAAILAITAIEDIEPIRNCTKLNFLEIFTTNITDISPLEDLVNLEYLNISNIEIDDISPLFGLEKLKQVNCLIMGDIPEEQVARFKELFPDTYSIFYPYSDPTEYYWRRKDDGSMTERYALLTKQIGYDTNDMSVYPRGYVTEEITMEDVPAEWYS